MDEKHDDARMADKPDRRFLTRDTIGRRNDDHVAHNLLSTQEDSLSEPRATPATYLFVLLAVIIVGVVSVRSLNAQLAPLLYSDPHIWKVGEELSVGSNYLTYDLNIETRGLRRESIRNLTYRPELAVMGASHWQEAHSAIAPDTDFYNAHVHRDYYEDLVAVASWFFLYDRMPEKLVISIRDNQFTAVEDRTDFLWVPVLPDYRRAAGLFGLEPHLAYANGLTPRLRQTVSLNVLWANVERYFAAEELPRSSDAMTHPTLDVLLSDGGIYWSAKHRRSFTNERARSQALELARAKIASPPTMDPEGLRTLDQVLSFLVEHEVEVFLAHPPFNPIFWDAVQGSRYMPELEKVETAVADLAAKHGIAVIGGFNPYEVGCTQEMYIDGEHSSPLCLGEVLLDALSDPSVEISTNAMDAAQ